MNLALVHQVRVPVLVFPLVHLLADALKFVCVFVLLLGLLWWAGYPPKPAWLSVPLLLACVAGCAFGCGLLLAAIMPFLPDLRFVIEQVLGVAMFLSGVVFALEKVPAPYAQWLAWNPLTVLLQALRNVLLLGQWPDWSMLARMSVLAFGLAVLGTLCVQRLAPRYPKLAA